MRIKPRTKLNTTKDKYLQNNTLIKILTIQVKNKEE